MIKGILKAEKGETFILKDNGEKCLQNEQIWHGYIEHWQNKKVRARLLPQRDYKTGSPIVLVWPDEPSPDYPYFELYYNERLIFSPASLLGHIAINVNNEVFNFSIVLNEDEAISPEEYFYRPALGEFAPAPGRGRTDRRDKEKPYYDKFGRSFMRTIHVLRAEGINTSGMLEFLRRRMQRVLETPVNPKRPDIYTGFRVFTESCSTIIRDALREHGFPGVRGIFPRDMFVNAAVYLLKEQEKGRLKLRLYKKPQLKVKEAPYSALSPLLNPCNWFRIKKLASLRDFMICRL